MWRQVKKQCILVEKRSLDASPTSVQKEPFTLKRDKPMMRVSSSSTRTDPLTDLRSFTLVHLIVSVQGTPRNEASPLGKKDEPEPIARHPSTPTNDKAIVDQKKKTAKSPSIISFPHMKDDEANYKTIFQQLDPDDELKLGSRTTSPVVRPSDRPRTRRGRDDFSDTPLRKPSIDPLVGLDDLSVQTARSKNQPENDSLRPTTTAIAITTNDHLQQFHLPEDEDD